MPDRITTTALALDLDPDLDVDEQYDNYLYKLLSRLALLSLWDICILFARNMLREHSVPNCIKNLDQDLIYGLEPESDDELVVLKVIQEWLSEQIVKSISKNEIKPNIIGKYFNGEINPKRTYLNEKLIIDWLLSRDVSASCNYNDEEAPYYESLDAIHYYIISEVRLLKAYAYDNTSFYDAIDNKLEGSTDIPREHFHLLIENKSLRKQLNQTTTKNSTYKKLHGNTERFAQNREQILGAALSVIIQWSDQCQNSLGKFEATKIAKLIDEKSSLFWPETGAPPLGLEKMEREIIKWIKKSGK